MLCEGFSVSNTGVALGHFEHFKAFLAEAVDHGDRWDEPVVFLAAVVGAICHHAWGVLGDGAVHHWHVCAMNVLAWE